jgi:hypothetical protein
VRLLDRCEDLQEHGRGLKCVVHLLGSILVIPGVIAKLALGLVEAL